MNTETIQRAIDEHIDSFLKQIYTLTSKSIWSAPPRDASFRILNITNDDYR